VKLRLPLRALDRKLLRDFVRMRGQLLAIAAVIACGLGLYLGMRTVLVSLDSARASYYATERFADIFAGLRRAPEHVAERLRALPGVQRLQTRVVADATLDVTGMHEAVTGRLLSLPDQGTPELNGLRLRSGRWPEPGRGGEVLLNEPFARAHRLVPGAELGAVLHGRWERLRVVGTALSPEYTIALGPGMLVPDNRRFGVLWLRREALAAAFDLDGAFNDVSLQLGRGARAREVLQRVDAILAPYGGVGAIERKDQQSAFFVANELNQLRTFGTMVPLVFLAVSSFLIHIVIGRIVASQREQIASLKALGYRDREVGLHYAKLVGVVVGVGALGGTALAAWVGSSMTGIYVEVYHFPELPFRFGWADIAQAVAIAAGAAGLGAAGGVLRTVRLPPAEAMRPEAPPVYRATLLERLGLDRWVSPASRMVLREIERRPLRSLLSLLGIALAAALMVLSTFSYGAINHLMNVQFGLTQRANVDLALYQPRAMSGRSAIAQLPGVLHAEPYRSVPVRLRNGPGMKNTAILGVPADATLHALLDSELREIPIPREGVVLSRKLAQVLGVAAGDQVRVEILEGERAQRSVTVARVAQTFVGVTAYMELGALCRLLGETPSFSGAWLSVDAAALPALHAAAKQTPAVAGIVSRDTSLHSLRVMMDANLGVSVFINTAFSLVLALGVLYNAARITLAERARDLASLRVLGFRRGEVAAILLGELGLLTGVATPLGLAIGHGLVVLLARSPGFDSEQFRVPEVITLATYAGAVLTVGVAALISGWNAWRLLDRMDIAEVLKTRD
jgi:putative ABC transport system permease protein